MRLNKYLASCGVASRREAEELIFSGLVTINGTKITNPAHPVEEEDWVKVSGKTVRPKPPVYYVFYKPKQMITTMTDEKGRPCVGEVTARLPGGVFPVGRLDWLSEGLLFLTNDGDWAQLVQHPKNKIPKVYSVKIRGTLEPHVRERLTRGMTLDGRIMRMTRLSPTGKLTRAGHSWWEITLMEGRSRQIRRMLKAVGHPVQKLKRVAIGPIRLGSMKPGDLRVLTERERKAITEHAMKGGANENS
ncbi:MAG TPA: pseudouridine synthase [Thermoanaerobaculia bacterium]|nr:pseudouridine synthase [Thermoanaerobaculia bacterium]HUM29597.1 pseudouridine synthase [Thermoanaerobaculia bacterium]HXK67248.1 pseudouridine synthase [Thermoanaerobaculia bacterium]